MKEQQLRQIIREKIHWKHDENNSGYDGFNMSGFNGAHYQNLEIVSRFRQYMTCPVSQGERKEHFFIIPIFWKGSHALIRLEAGQTGDERYEIIDDWSGGNTTENLLFKIITTQYPDILKT